jgi:ribosome-associated toxin RatA of RatAB toxin-antitoxin module
MKLICVGHNILTMKIITWLFLFFAVNPLILKADWEQKMNKEGIQVFTAKLDNSKFKSVKVICTINTGPAQLIALLFDIDRHPEWVYNAKGDRLLKKISDKELIYYSEVKTPFPVTNRDFISHLKLARTSAKVITIASQAEPNYLPEKKGIVRVKNSKANWTITTLNNNETRIEYVIQFDPAGSVPAWLVNMFVTEGPFQTFRKLKQRVQMPEYKNAVLPV